MDTIILSLLPPIFGATLGGPMWIVMALLLLRGESGSIKAAAFAAGGMTVRLLQGILFGYLLAYAEKGRSEEGPDLIASTLLLAVGVVLIITGATALWRMEDDSDTPPPKWMKILNRVSAPAAFGMGVVMMVFAMKQWIFTLSALAIIERAQLSMKASVFAYLIFVVAAQSLMLTPIICSLAAPTRSAKTLAALQAWLERHNRKIAAVASLIFGAWFFWRGTAGLLSHDVLPHYHPSGLHSFHVL
jgi:hypothetical protein